MDNPAFSSVKLADAWLTVADLAEVARGAQLVTLSACETGVSEPDLRFPATNAEGVFKVRLA